MRKNLPKKEPAAKKPVTSLKTTPRMRSTANTPKHSSRIGSPDLSERASKVKPLQGELKELDILRTLLMQWSFANSVAETALARQSEEAKEQIADRGRQIVDLKKQQLSLMAEHSAREKTQLVDEVLNLEYGKLQSRQDTILMSAAYLEDIENLAKNSLERVIVGEGVVISPYECLSAIDNANSAMKAIYGRLEDDIKSFRDLAQQMETLDFIVKEEMQELEESKELKGKVEDLSEEYKLLVIHSSMPNVQKEILALLEEPLT